MKYIITHIHTNTTVLIIRCVHDKEREEEELFLVDDLQLLGLMVTFQEMRNIIQLLLLTLTHALPLSLNSIVCFFVLLTASVVHPL